MNIVRCRLELSQARRLVAGVRLAIALSASDAVVLAMRHFLSTEGNVGSMQDDAFGCRPSVTRLSEYEFRKCCALLCIQKAFL